MHFVRINFWITQTSRRKSFPLKRRSSIHSPNPNPPREGVDNKLSTSLLNQAIGKYCRQQKSPLWQCIFTVYYYLFHFLEQNGFSFQWFEHNWHHLLLFSRLSNIPSIAAVIYGFLWLRSTPNLQSIYWPLKSKSTHILRILSNDVFIYLPTDDILLLWSNVLILVTAISILISDLNR